MLITTRLSTVNDNVQLTYLAGSTVEQFARPDRGQSASSALVTTTTYWIAHLANDAERTNHREEWQTERERERAR